jgi:CheY-like chemotaxis protein
VGIPPLDQDRLFEAFTQLPGQHRPGTGLGLAICRHFVESMGGTIGVDSTVGAGSTFWLELDLPRFEEATGDVLHTSLNDQRLLVVHECLAVRKLAEDYLRYAGASVHSFASVEEVLAKLDVLCAVPFDALLVDEHRSAQSLREELARRQADPPALIFLDHRRQRAAGDHDTPSLEQPLHIHHLLDTVGTALSRRQGHDETVHDRNLRYCRTRPVTDPRIKRVNRPRRVLLVEDDPINCTVVTRMLETLRCTVTHAPDGPDAVAAARASEFDLILMDCQLPTFTGIEATRQIRGLDTERTTHQPILALSANVMPEFRQACIEAGMDDFLLKPVNRDQLSRALLEWCGGETLDEASSAASDRIEPPVVFDRDALLARFDYEEDLVDAVVDAFCQDLPRRLDLMREAVKLRRSEDLDRHAHTLAGAAGQVGADTIAQAAERIRQAIRAHDWDRVRYNIGWLFEESQLFERLISGELTSVIDESEDETPS